MDDKHFTMWIKADCCFCIKAREEFFRQKVSHTIYIMDNNLDELESMKKKWSHPTVPIVVLQDGENEKLIGGYSELKGWFDGVDKND